MKFHICIHLSKKLQHLLEHSMNAHLSIGAKIMSAISDFATKQNAFNDKMDQSVSDISSDIQTMKDLIDKLQNSPGSITPEDQALLDQLQQRSQNISDKLDALDQLTPPTVPTA